MEPSSETTTTSPRISFSHDLHQSDLITTHAPNHRAHVSDDSDFEFGFELILAADFSPSPADDIFSDGKLLPLPPIPTPKPSLLSPAPVTLTARHGSLRELMSSADVAELGKAGKKPAPKSFWDRLGRSSSLGSCRSSYKTGSMCPFPLLRSKSTGSSLAPSIRPRPNYGNVVNNGNNRRRIYSNGYEIGVSPVLDMPSSSGMSLVSYLMCSCGSKNMRGGLPVACSP
ncbi:uncharacterized protein [Typha latifolia]|uniref:uncharacterized protein n=1 Tax=Typha latifolia TaxID=4733 RepID=UPI003C2F4E9F